MVWLLHPLVWTAVKGNEYWIGLTNKASGDCVNSKCDGVLMWETDGTDYVHSIYAPNDVKSGSKPCVKFKDAGTDGEDCTKEWPVLCQTGCNTPPGMPGLRLD